MSGPMSGVRVVEIAQYTLVPAAGALLAEWGADVIKVESAGGGDAQRRMVRLLNLNRGDDPDFLPTVEGPNRGKRSIALALAEPGAQRILHRLVETADVLMTNVTPPSRERLGITPEQIRAVNPRVIYVSATGFGSTGPEADKRAFDVTAFWARSGAAVLATADGDEHLGWQPVPAFGDNVAALAVAAGTSAALYQRHSTGAGALVDVSLLAVGAWTTQYVINLALNGDQGATGRRNRRGTPSGNPLMASYRTRDGHWLVLATAEPYRWWADFCARIGLKYLIDIDVFPTPAALEAGADAASKFIQAAIGQQDLAEWLPRLDGFGAPWSVARDPYEAGTDPTLREFGGVIDVRDGRGEPHSLVAGPVRFDASHPATARRAPGPGEDTDSILGDLGYEPGDIAELRDRGVIG
jgi:crotonobetainyl-CoA:carnitine CoA-transferase CaiB-like acyl-CoA transferase